MFTNFITAVIREKTSANLITAVSVLIFRGDLVSAFAVSKVGRVVE